MKKIQIKCWHVNDVVVACLITVVGVFVEDDVANDDDFDFDDNGNNDDVEDADDNDDSGGMHD